MITDDAADHVLSEVFAQRAQDRPDTTSVLTELHRRIDRRRHVSRRPVVVLATAAAVVALALGTAALIDKAQPSAPAARPAPASPYRQGEDQLTATCLDLPTVLTAWGDPKGGYSGLATDESGAACTNEANTTLPTHPPAASTVVAGGRTIYIAKSPPGIRTGYLALNPADSAAAAQASGQNWDPNRPYYLIVSIPADNPQSVLVSVLKQFVLPGH